MGQGTTAKNAEATVSLTTSQRYNDHFAETESWEAAKGKILALGATNTTDHDVLVTGGNDGIVSFWSGETGSKGSVSASARSNGNYGYDHFAYDQIG